MTVAKVWTGTVGRELMFKGSKSEGLYLTFRTDTHALYRLRVLHQDSTDALNHLVGSKVSLEATEDDLRGHRRLTVTLDAIKASHVIEELSQANSPETQSSEARSTQDQSIPDQLIPDQFIPDQFIPDQFIPEHIKTSDELKAEIIKNIHQQPLSHEVLARILSMLNSASSALLPKDSPDEDDNKKGTV